MSTIGTVKMGDTWALLMGFFEAKPHDTCTGWVEQTDIFNANGVKSLYKAERAGL